MMRFSVAFTYSTHVDFFFSVVGSEHCFIYSSSTLLYCFRLHFIMAAVFRWTKRLVQRPPSPSKRFHRLFFPDHRFRGAVKEEHLLYYKPEEFYPVHIGEIFKNQYQVVGKLGYGAYSTVWLCRDLVYVNSCTCIKIKLT